MEVGKGVLTPGLSLSDGAHAVLCRLGNALVESLDELIQSGHINPQLALRVLNQVSGDLSQPRA